MLLLLALPAGEAAGAAEPAPQRVVSINLCADQLLIALADPGQVASLSRFATDPTLSYLAGRAASYRHDAGLAETVVGTHPDLVLAGRFTRLATREMLGRLGYRLIEIDQARSIEEAVAQVREIAALLGHPERGEALAADIAAAEQEAAAAAALPGPAPTVAVYQRRGYVTGAETLTSALLDAVGLANLGGALAAGSGGFVPLERIVSDGPDYLIVAADAGAVDQGSALLDHPALARLYPPERRIILPERLTVCAGPSLPEALRHLAAEARRVRR